jgi:hypothetical protein
MRGRPDYVDVVEAKKADKGRTRTRIEAIMARVRDHYEKSEEKLDRARARFMKARTSVEEQARISDQHQAHLLSLQHELDAIATLERAKKW